MGFAITAHSAQRMRATAEHSNETHWVEIEVTESFRGRKETTSNITVFFDGDNAARKADAYANAINIVDEKFHPQPVQEPA